MRRRFLVLLAVLAALVIGGAYAAKLWLDREYVAPGPAQSAFRIQVEPGTSIRSKLSPPFEGTPQNTATA